LRCTNKLDDSKTDKSVKENVFPWYRLSWDFPAHEIMKFQNNFRRSQKGLNRLHVRPSFLIFGVMINDQFVRSGQNGIRIS